jgi:hypothetical protein
MTRESEYLYEYAICYTNPRGKGSGRSFVEQGSPKPFTIEGSGFFFVFETPGIFRSQPKIMGEEK